MLNVISGHRKTGRGEPYGWPPEAGEGTAGRDGERLISGKEAVAARYTR